MLTIEEHRSGRHDAVRSAFPIGDGHVLTAWHCVRAIGGSAARLWLRLQPRHPGGAAIDIPVFYVDHEATLDAALLAFDEQRAMPSHDGELEDLVSYLDAVALPLTTEIEAYDQVRVAGHPERNPARYSVIYTGKVQQATSRIGKRSVVRVHVASFGSRSAEIPSGMSGGPLLRRDPDSGVETVVGFVSTFPTQLSAEGTAEALGATVLCGRIADLRERFQAVEKALLRQVARLATVSAAVEERLSEDAIAAHRVILESAGALPAAWTSLAIRQLLERQTGISRVTDVLQLLAAAVEAKPVFAACEGYEIALGQLHGIYRREIGDWPVNGSADAMLVQASDIDLRERRDTGWTTMSPLARFLVGVAAERRIAVDDSLLLRQWLIARGYQLGDARQHQKLHRRGGWLLLDLGDEPGPSDQPYPFSVRWTLITDDDVISRTVDADGTRGGLLLALREVFRELPPTHPLVVDLAAPSNLLIEAIDQWPVREVDGELEPLSSECRPRLRWSPRLRRADLYGRLVDRLTAARWDHLPEPLAPSLLADESGLIAWARSRADAAWLVGALPVVRPVKPLRQLLRNGHGFMVWLHGSNSVEGQHAVREAAGALPVPARRDHIPENLPVLAAGATVIWDDPQGREGFSLPMTDVESC
ncbi:trypsin-like peptidase domain-containing protein [Actinoplanes auranticolor]|uniref:trypsin-like peptidase domain-containing protein n=1 Tax=Actinoplanes auranticolor TaxID=47988 RepID=UPI001BB39F12|nr:trypsin-like peptidase domain-containing protein [Actinoplanes auranticolor]